VTLGVLTTTDKENRIPTFGYDLLVRRRPKLNLQDALPGCGNCAIVDLLADAITAYEQRQPAFLDLADRFQKSEHPAETKRLRQELARVTFAS